MKKCFLIEKGYGGVEEEILFLSQRTNPDIIIDIASNSKLWRGDFIPVGSPRFIEDVLGNKLLPNHCPDFMSHYLGRKIHLVNSKFDLDYLSIEEKGNLFVRPADQIGRFCSFVYPIEYNNQKPPFFVTPYIETESEFRVYVSDGQIINRFWYKGENETFPMLFVDWPDNFCGAVDFGINYKNEMFLLGNHLPCCRWLSGHEDGDKYIDWIIKGWKYIQNEN